jgi:hypothetical protein
MPQDRICQRWRKSTAYASNINKIIAFVVAYNDRTAVFAILRVAANYQISALVFMRIITEAPDRRPGS